MTSLTKFNRGVLGRREGGYRKRSGGEAWPPSDLTVLTLPLEVIQELIDGVGNYLHRLYQLEAGWRKWAVGCLYYTGVGIAVILLAMYKVRLDDIVNHSRKVER